MIVKAKNILKHTNSCKITHLKKKKNLKKKSQQTCYRADRAAVSQAPRVGRNHHAADLSLGGISQELSNRSGE